MTVYMARQRKQTKPAKRYQRRARRYARKYPISQGPINRTTVVKLRYVDTKTLNTSALIPFNSHIYRINDLYDPDYTGVGHQAMYRDQMFGLYRFGRVLSASIKIVPSTVTLSTLRVGVCPVPDGNADTDYNTAAERRQCKTRVYNTSSNTPVIKVYNSSDSYLGIAKGQTKTQPGLRQSPTSSVQTQYGMFYQIFVYDPIASGTVATIFNVEITQYVMFEEPVNPVGS